MASCAAIGSSTETKSSECKVLELTLNPGKTFKPPLWTRMLSLGKPILTYSKVRVEPTATRVFTRIDEHGESDTNWNHKLFISEKNGLFSNKNSKVVINIEIYAVAVGLMKKDQLIGTNCLEMKDVPTNKSVCFRNRKVKHGLMHVGWIDEVKIRVCDKCPRCLAKEVTKNCTECLICLEGFELDNGDHVQDNWVLQVCGHKFHGECMLSWYNIQRKRTCPTCRRVVHPSQIISITT